MSPRPILLCLAMGAGAALVSGHAHADDEPPSAERIKAAADEFDRGRRAYLAKDYEQAASHFENAFRSAPSKETLRLAIRARRDAKQPARAATLAAIAEERYAEDVPTAKLARSTLAEAAPELAEYVVTCSEPCALASDGRVVSQSDGLHHRIYLEPGVRELGASFEQGGSASQRVEGTKGTSTEVLLERPPPPPPPAAPATSVREAPPPRPRAAPSSGKPFGPALFWVGAGLTVGAGAATIWSGVDTIDHPGAEAVRKVCAGRSEACPLYQEGRNAQLRTNVLIGATAGVAVLTGIVGVFLTRWSSPPSGADAQIPGEIGLGSARVTIAPSGISGRF